VQGPNDLANGRPGTQYTFDSDGRPSCTTAPDGGESCTSYPSQLETDVTTTTLPEGTSDTIQSFTDIFGRTTTVKEENSGAETDTTFDFFSRVNSVSNPHYQGESGVGISYFAYDALGRKTSQEAPDTSVQTWTYSGNSLTFQDANGNQRSMGYDSAGRLLQVKEPSGTTSTPYLETDYSNYDALDNPWTITQCGGSCPGSSSRIRSFTFDGMARLTSATNPESGASTYSYDGNGNVVTKVSPAVNQPLGTQTLAYCYDPLNRMLYEFHSSSFSCSNPTGFASSYSYDSSGLSGAANDIGMLTDEKSYAGSTLVSDRALFEYDAMGRLQKEQQCIFGNCTTMAFQPNYTWDTSGKQLSYSTGISPISTVNPLTFNYSYDTSGRLETISSNWADPTHPSTLFTAQAGQSSSCANPRQTAYAAFGGLMGANLGNGLALSRAYDVRLRLNCEIDNGSINSPATSGSGTVTITGLEQSK